MITVAWVLTVSAGVVLGIVIGAAVERGGRREEKGRWRDFTKNAWLN